MKFPDNLHWMWNLIWVLIPLFWSWAMSWFSSWEVVGIVFV